MKSKLNPYIVDYVILILGDEFNKTAAGAAFDWTSRGTKNRAAMSAYGDEIPVPWIAIAIPAGTWERLNCSKEFGGKSNHTIDGTAIRMSAAARDFVQNQLLPVCKIVDSGLSTEISSYFADNGKVEHNTGKGAEVRTTGGYNTNHGDPVDGIIRLRVGAVLKNCRVQVKASLPTFRREDVPDNSKPGQFYRRGTRAGYSTANSLIDLREG